MTVRVTVLVVGTILQSLRASLMRLTLVGALYPAVRWRTFGITLCTIAGRCGGLSATCIAPPPMTAPPQVQAHNFAKAIFTDIRAPCSMVCSAVLDKRSKWHCLQTAVREDADAREKRNIINHVVEVNTPLGAGFEAFRPNSGQSIGAAEHVRAPIAAVRWDFGRGPARSIRAVRCPAASAGSDTKMSRCASKRGQIFDRFLNGLLWLLCDGIGALGRAPTSSGERERVRRTYCRLFRRE